MILGGFSRLLQEELGLGNGKITLYQSESCLCVLDEKCNSLIKFPEEKGHKRQKNAKRDTKAGEAC